MELYSIGLMSGTSMDGIDAALLKTDGKAKIESIGNDSLIYDPETQILLKAAEFSARRHEGNIQEITENFSIDVSDYLKKQLQLSEQETFDKIQHLTQYLHSHYSDINQISYEAVIQHSTILHGDLVERLLKKLALNAKKIDLMGYHGQTLYHNPAKKIALQIGDGQSLANRLGIAVVNDFRTADVKAGGQGAPLAPLYHQALAARDHRLPLAVVNCGGIGNITFIWGTGENDIIGFDTGPGNALIDRYIRIQTQGQEQMDKDGKYGLKGKINEAVLKALIKNNKNYLEQKPPKSLDINDLPLISELDSLPLTDACATLEAFTAQTIADSLQWLDKKHWPQDWILAGGGWNNPVIRAELKKRLAPMLENALIQTADEAGWNSQFLEAEIFAYFAVRSVKGCPLSVPATTGVPKPLSGGVLSLPQGGASVSLNALLAAS